MEDRNMKAVEHFEELRKRLIITLAVFMLFLTLSFTFVQDIYHYLVKGLPFKLALLGPGDIIVVYLTIAAVIAGAGTIPVAAHQLWLFVKPALSQSERKVALAYIPALFLLFLTGLAFGYFVLFPIILSFLMSLSGDMFQTFFTTEKYFKFLLNMTLPFGLLFEMPVVMMFLTSLGVVNPYKLRAFRKYSYFALIVLSVFITPPDFVSDVLVIVPLILLYELSVSLSKIVYKRKMAKQAEEEAEWQALG
ncbi:twin-arginine translocase subunit TatC [Bacillus badius]|uniref:Sec-independent protein translocase protein TatC n=1 Tax=Bacillus badius TaxID=1455 RepID=A0ABR5AQ65_BACBA|nr:twin-arginine translocase subunit TatC [Bacillus badius]KIL72139.1 Twin-arginine translocation protein TatC [Bacillus badius]KIL76905.1 Twin-arginine translocation protein TatC [Bacillus badius]KZN98163.1 preprotein translocase subunit TatC [Bacillus badius]KZR58220.1 preprotein translocase subunit TatC [Bacillus badius]MED4717758.1 twin-arginine translocase subunit TatC [Bacillus badius]